MGLPHRKTRRRFEQAGEMRFLTFSCYRRLPLFQNDEIKDAFVRQIANTMAARPFGLVAWVVMPEHVHLLIMPNLPEHPVRAVLQHLKGCFANTVLRRWRHLNAPILPRLTDSEGKLRFWLGGGGYDRNILSPAEYPEKFHYIHENPVQRRLAAKAVDWVWSSARWYAGLENERDLPITPIEL